MSFINKVSKEIYFKIIYVGPAQSGKTTNIQEIYKRTSTQQSEWTALPITPSSTPLFDFLPLQIGSLRGFSSRLHLYTIPENILFTSTSKLIFKGVDGIVFVADSNPLKIDKNIECLKKLKTKLKDEGYDLRNIPLVVQYNKRDLQNAEPVSQLHLTLNLYKSPEFESVATSGQGVLPTLKKITEKVIEVLENSSSELKNS